MDDYFTDPAMNWSRLKLLDEEATGCPADLRDALDNPTDTDTHSRRGLRLVHTLVLEPQHFRRDYYVSQAHAATVDSVRQKLATDTDDALTQIVRARLNDWPLDIVVTDARRNSNEYKAVAAANPVALILKTKERDDLVPKADAVAHDIAAQDAGRTRITQTQFDEASEAAEAVRSHPVAGPIVTNAANEYEGVLRYTDPETGEECKGRADVQDHAERMVWDLKGMRSVHPRQMEREIGRMRYHGQGAHYTKPNGYGFGIIGYAKCPASGGYRVTVMELGPSWMAAGMALRDRLMSRFAECKRTNRWPDHNDGGRIVADDPPAYVLSAAFGDDEGVTVTYDDGE